MYARQQCVKMKLSASAMAADTEIEDVFRFRMKGGLEMHGMMKLAAGALAALTLLGCASTYTIRTKDGREFQAAKKPDITDDRYVRFTTTAGNKVLLKQDEISVISED